MKRKRQLLIDIEGVGKRKCGDCAMATISSGPGGMCLEFGVYLEPVKRDNFLRCDECLAAEGRAGDMVATEYVETVSACDCDSAGRDGKVGPCDSCRGGSCNG